MDRTPSRLDFRLMTLGFKIRDLYRPRINILREAGIQPGSTVLDYGCGAGSYVAPLARLLGPAGRIYALDMNPMAIKATQKVITRGKIQIAQTILSDRSTGLPDESVDVVLLYDTFHHLSQPREVLRELRRVLKPDGTLSCSDHHLEEHEIVTGMTQGGMFRLQQKAEHTYRFSKV